MYEYEFNFEREKYVEQDSLFQISTGFTFTMLYLTCSVIYIN